MPLFRDPAAPRRGLVLCAGRFNVRRIDRPLHLLFWQRLMSAGIRTADGDEAGEVGHRYHIGLLFERGSCAFLGLLKPKGCCVEPPGCVHRLVMAACCFIILQRASTLAVMLACRFLHADYYFIPINTRMIISSDLATWALPYVKRTWPYWRRDNGTRHFIIHTGNPRASGLYQGNFAYNSPRALDAGPLSGRVQQPSWA